MNRKNDLSGIILALVVGVTILSAMLIRAFLPHIILPRLNASNMVLLSVISLVLNHYISKRSTKLSCFIPFYAALIFGIFPWVASFITYTDAIKAGLLGAVIFSVTAFLFDSMMDRISTGKGSKIEPVVGGAGIYLAAQSLMGII